MNNDTHIKSLLSELKDPYLDQDLIRSGCVKRIKWLDKRPHIEISLGYPLADTRVLEEAICEKIQSQLGCERPLVEIRSHIKSHAVQSGLTMIPNVKNIIAVASGKGGVGKSTTAANLALALQAQGAQVAVLDADIYGPNQPQILGAQSKPESVDGKFLKPVMCYGIQTMSIGYLIQNDDTPMIWRGPMVTRAMMQLLTDTLWENVDYLIIDLPPGTGDIQLTLAQKVPVSAAIIVTTPQDIALLDVRKAWMMFQRVKVPVLGVVENMAYHTCGECGHQGAIFGEGGGAQLSKQFDVPLLGQLPLLQNIREQADAGKPSVIADPKSEIAETYTRIALRAAARLSLQARNYASNFPNIVIEKTE